MDWVKFIAAIRVAVFIAIWPGICAWSTWYVLGEQARIERGKAVADAKDARDETALKEAANKELALMVGQQSLDLQTCKARVLELDK